ncbi:MAG: hypothetical protein N2662_07315 [Bacteroidales bacterium]|nr:hypothetical protein [Bacteroidales bacterium]
MEALKKQYRKHIKLYQKKFNVCPKLLSQPQIRYLVFIASIAITFTSCEKKEYYYIPADKQTTLKTGDTVCFIDQHNRVDTFVIKIWRDFIVSDKRYYWESILIRYTKYNKMVFSIKQNQITLHLSSYGYYYFEESENYDLIDLEINNNKYKALVYKSLEDFPDTLPSIIYYSYKYGILRYDYNNGNSFVIKQ